MFIKSAEDAITWVETHLKLPNKSNFYKGVTSKQSLEQKKFVLNNAALCIPHLETLDTAARLEPLAETSLPLSTGKKQNSSLNMALANIYLNSSNISSQMFSVGETWYKTSKVCPRSMNNYVHLI